MKKITTAVIAAFLAFSAGCKTVSKKKEESSKTNKKAISRIKNEDTKHPSSAEVTIQASESPSETGDNDTNEIYGNYQIISFDQGSGEKETYNPGHDGSIMGSSSIILKKDGSCEFNLPGVGKNTGCTWFGNTLQAAGAEIEFNIDGDVMTIRENGETYEFRKAK